MAFLDVHRMRAESGGPLALLVMQSDQFERLDTVLVAPCRSADDGAGLGRLTPVIEVAGARLRVWIPELAAIRRADLPGAPIGSAAAWRDDLVAALDRLVTGF